MILFFVCDVEKCNDEEDLGSAIVYFHPSEISYSEQHILCSQIVGVSQFLQVTFASPLIINLDTRTYVACQTQNYILVLGSAEIGSHLLKKKLRFIHSLFSFYYLDFAHVFHESNNDRNLFLKHVQIILDQCLLLAKNPVFGTLSRSVDEEVSCDIYEKSSELLAVHRWCSEVIGGAVLSKHKLLATDLTWDLTSYLLLLSTCDSLLVTDVHVPFSLPSGVSLKYVYLTDHAMKGDEAVAKNLRTDPHRTFFGGTPLFDNDILHSQNNESLSFVLTEDEEEKKKACASNRLRLLSYKTRKEKGFNLCPVNVICKHHSLLHNTCEKWNEKCYSDSVVKSICDFEFQCFLCAEFTDYFCSKNALQCLYHSKAGILDLPCLGKKATSKRVSTFVYYSEPFIINKKSCVEQSEVLPNTFSMTNRSLDSNCPRRKILSPQSELHKTISNHCITENNSFRLSSAREKAILYVYRHADIFVFLLMKSLPSEGLLNFLWNCSSSAVINFAFHLNENCERIKDKKNDVLFCSYHYESGMFHGSHQLNLELQSVHEDFVTDASFHSIYIGKYNKSIYACNDEKHQLFYERKERSIQKASWLAQLYSRAYQKAKKYFSVSFPKF